MRSVRLLLAIVLAIPFPLLASQGGVPPQDIEALVARHAELDMFSGTVIVARHGRVVHSSAYGQANRDY